MERKITHGPDQQPLYGCCNCFEDYSHRAEDLAVYEGELWCDNCWSETDIAYEKGIPFGDLEPFVPEIDRLRAELERLRADAERCRDALLKEAAGLERAATGMHDKPHRLSAWKDEEWQAYGPERLLLTAARMRQAARGE